MIRSLALRRWLCTGQQKHDHTQQTHEEENGDTTALPARVRACVFVQFVRVCTVAVGERLLGCMYVVFSGQLFCIRLSGAWQTRISCTNAGVCRCVCEQTQLAIGSIQKPYGQTPEKQHHSTLRWQIRLPKPRAGFGLGFAS